MFLPEIFARYFIKILSVRPERLLDISEEDCEKEGIQCWAEVYYPSYPIDNNNPHFYRDICDSYFSLWDSINGKNSHKLNPWVWVYEYQLTERKEL
jgi:hypothetical protein